ncbi:MAG: glycosyltransferase [Balneolales bacterium]
MKVIHSVASLMPSFGGPARSVSELCRLLSHKVESVEIFTTLAKGDEEQPLPTDLIKIHFVNGKDMKRFRLSWSPEFKELLQERINSFQPDIMHDHGMWLQTNHVAVSLAKNHKIPSLISPRGMVEPWALKHKAWKKKIAWNLYQKKDLQKATVLHATATGEANHLRALGLKQPIAIVPNGVNLADPNEETSETEKNERICFFLGRIYPVKGLLNLVEAWGKVNPKGWKVILAGPDESSHKAKVESAIKKRNLEKVFSFVGPVEEKEKKNWFNKADLVVLPSFSENFGIVVAEALNYGIPVITTKGTPWQELITHNCGWWVDIGVEPLSEAIREATSMDADELWQMGSRGRELIKSRYSWPVQAEIMYEVYQWMLNDGQPPACIQF